MHKRDDRTLWYDISNNWRWDFSEVLASQAVFVALRAWATERPEAVDLVEDWFYHPWQYKSQRKKLHLELVNNLRNYFQDPRLEWKFYADGVFSFDTQAYEQSWSALRDFDCLARAAGLRGMIILFDEFEDVITNLNNIQHEESAFSNLFHFLLGEKFPGKTFYAVTPAFVDKCKNRLLQKERWDFKFSHFDALPTHKMSPLTKEQLEELSMRILKTHGIAYDWEPDYVMKAAYLREIVSEAERMPIQDRTRYVIKAVAKSLDKLLQDSR